MKLQKINHMVLGIGLISVGLQTAIWILGTLLIYKLLVAAFPTHPDLPWIVLSVLWIVYAISVVGLIIVLKAMNRVHVGEKNERNSW